MIGPGTGIAPMRAILQERSHWRKALPTKDHGPNILYFGCKNRSTDYIYRNELESFQNEGTLTELHLAFSREQDHKVYVQHLLSNRSAQTWKLIHDDKAHIFVCGAVSMGASVVHTLQDIIVDHGKMSREEAKVYFDKMTLEGRFVQELWS
jgi:NADPH-ferrihemoprotein reductase